jgi:outer membrane protein insertion porin family
MDGAAVVAPPTIGRISVEGNLVTDSTRILRTFEVRSGQSFASDAVRRGTRKLIGLGLFSNVVIRRVLDSERNLVDLVIVVTERPRIARIRFEGMKKREESDLEKKLFLKVGETYSATATSNQADTLRQYYRDEGFPRARITAKVDTLEGRNDVELRFVVEEGEKVRITVIRFEGGTAFSAARLRKVMKTKQKGFFGGGDLKDETFAEDREKLEGWYHDHGYRDMTVGGFEVTPGAKPRELTLTVSLNEGRVYRMGPSRVVGKQHPADGRAREAVAAQGWAALRQEPHPEGRLGRLCRVRRAGLSVCEPRAARDRGVGFDHRPHGRSLRGRSVARAAHQHHGQQGHAREGHPPRAVGA